MRKNIIILIAALAGMLSLAANGETFYNATILRVDGTDVAGAIETLESQGVKVLRHRGDMVLAYVPVTASSRNAVSRLKKGTRPVIVREERARRAVPVMDVARKCYGAQRIEGDRNLPQGFTGKGVVTGFCDIGFDPLHINFRDDEGNCRVRRVVHYEEQLGKRTVMNTTQEYAEWKTDFPHQTHATHVAGILAGSYRPGNYYGMAPGSDIVGTVSEGTDVGLLAGIEDIIEYADSVGKPAVVNISMASLTGPRDGTTLFSQYLDILGKEAVICLSSGNFGSYPLTMTAAFTEEMPSAKVSIVGNDWMFFDMNGIVDAWSADGRPFRARLICRDMTQNKEVFALDWVDASKPFTKEFNAADLPAMAAIYTGSITMEGGLWKENGRSYINVYLDTHSTEYFAPDKVWSRYQWDLEVAGDPGVSVDVHPDLGGTRLQQIGGQPPLTNRDNISELVTGDNLICVGMYVSREEAPMLNGEMFNFNEGFKTGEVDYNSSYGQLADGRILPHTVAPGNMIISSVSSYFADIIKEETGAGYKEELSYEAKEGDKTYYWAINAGTSMACPYAAGCIATWLEAAPQMGVDDVLAILRKTNDTSKKHTDDPRHGHGWLRPYEGLVEALGVAAYVPGVIDTENTAPRLEYCQGALRIWNPAMESLRLTITSLDGRTVRDIAPAKMQVVDLPLDLPAGIYAATAHWPLGRTETLKLSIR